MGLKKNSKVTAEFNMSSLTDIIFLLLIFFMLTSSVISPNAINMKLPGTKHSASATAPSNTPEVRVTAKGNYYFNSKKYSSADALEKRMARIQGKDMILSPDRNAKIESVVAVMDIALRYNINAILAGENE